jgi:hypothetical protein
MVVLTTFIVNDGSRLFLTNLQSRCRAAELWCCGEVSSSARGDDDRHARREEQRASGLAKVVKSNLGKPGLSEVAFYRAYRPAPVDCVDGVCSPASTRTAKWLVWFAAILVVLFLAFPWFVKFII